MLEGLTSLKIDYTKKLISAFRDCRSTHEEDFINFRDKLNHLLSLYEKESSSSNVNIVSYNIGSICCIINKTNRCPDFIVLDRITRSVILYSSLLSTKEIVNIVNLSLIFSGKIKEFKPTWEYIFFKTLQGLRIKYREDVNKFVDDVLDLIDEKQGIDPVLYGFGDSKIFISIAGSYTHIELHIFGTNEITKDSINLYNMEIDNPGYIFTLFVILMKEEEKENA